jgi:hypothetical protein
MVYYDKLQHSDHLPAPSRDCMTHCRLTNFKWYRESVCMYRDYVFRTFYNISKFIVFFLWTDTWLVRGKSSIAWQWVMQFLLGAGKWQSCWSLTLYALYNNECLLMDWQRILRIERNKSLYYWTSYQNLEHFCMCYGAVSSKGGTWFYYHKIYIVLKL